MAQTPHNRMKPTLDKDLDKLSLVEEASYHLSRGLTAQGFGLLFLIISALVASVFVIGQPGGMIVFAAVIIGAYMAMNIGAKDVANNVGPAVGAKAMPIAVALIIGAICEVMGAVITGGNVVETISSGIINIRTIPDSSIFAWAMLSALITAALLVNLSNYLKAPISTTHTVVGGVAGAGTAAYGFGAVDWFSLGGIAMTWVATPFISAFFAILLLAFIKKFIIYRDDKIAAAQIWVPVLIGIMSGVFTAYLIWVGFHQVVTISFGTAVLSGLAVGLLSWRLCIPLIARQSQGLENRNQSLRKMFQWPLILAAALMSFAHGANDVSNAIGPVVAIVRATQGVIVGETARAPQWVMLIGAFGLSCGILLFGPRLIRLVGEQITKLNPMRAFCVSVSTALTVLVASRFGMPVSTTHTAIGAVFGVGFFREWYTQNARRQLEPARSETGNGQRETGEDNENSSEVRRRYLVRRSHFMTIVAAWIITVPTSAALSAGCYGIMYILFIRL
ncbi:putative phosphate transporter [Agrobacterium rubi TR3 = NBRC 13261]|uniref:Phosphate transporter n=1 Tax=Agrobacterium rubi TR3 = NBRC 13261 TaxID=1368415 RepID=A0A081CU12_9HYPH|nr:inorganic phosphate transporter [Agrobacterium rubi]MBP1880174.1 PiT family inorganic phosphate transporter [Agrobacterium rubi]MCL6652329.1 inorganic phosphate transporter [Agrobacterium rubi]GAK70158.1 putative phosphate transporter [Agrobacterium rubi TR3 = NBRC 13261]